MICARASGLPKVGSKLTSTMLPHPVLRFISARNHKQNKSFLKPFDPLMAQILEEGGQYYTSATMSSRLAYSDVGSVGDLTSYSTPREFHDYTASSTEVTPQHSPSAVRRTSSLPRSNRGGSSMVMNDRDKGIYNSLGSSSSSSGKVRCWHKNKFISKKQWS